MNERKPRILIADDFEENRIPLKLMLKLAGYDVLEAEDGRQAIEAVRREEPDLVLMDITLPVIDGLQATRELRRSPQFQRLPIVIISAHDNPAVHEEARAAGATAFAGKPIDFEQLKMLIAEWLNPG
jgi:CheY-like chemotaxis protein